MSHMSDTLMLDILTVLMKKFLLIQFVISSVLPLTHSFQMYPFYTPRKYQETVKFFLMFLGVRERVHWERMG